MHKGSSNSQEKLNGPVELQIRFEKLVVNKASLLMELGKSIKVVNKVKGDLRVPQQATCRWDLFEYENKSQKGAVI